MLKDYKSKNFIHIPRSKNSEADKLANKAIDTKSSDYEITEWL